MLTISKVFTIFCLLCLCRNREYPDSLQNKSVNSSFKWVSKYILCLARLRVEGRAFWSGQSYIYPLNYLLPVRVMLTILKVFIILFLLCLWEYGTPWKFSRQISALSFELTVQVYYLLGQNEEEEENLFWRVQEGRHIVRLPPRALG